MTFSGDAFICFGCRPCFWSDRRLDEYYACLVKGVIARSRYGGTVCFAGFIFNSPERQSIMIGAFFHLFINSVRPAYIKIALMGNPQYNYFNQNQNQNWLGKC